MKKSQKTFLSLLGTVLLYIVLHFFYTSPMNNALTNQNLSVLETSTVATSILSTSSTPEAHSFVLVARVVDGDTIELETGEKVRYIGVNTPETVSPKKLVECYGKEASNKNKELVAGQKVRLIKDVSQTDRYGRLLRYVYLEDGTFINLKLVQEGYAYADTFPPDVKYSKIFVAAQKQAQAQKQGLWAKCK